MSGYRTSEGCGAARQPAHPRCDIFVVRARHFFVSYASSAPSFVLERETRFVANYSSGSLTALAVQADGSLAGPVETLTHVGHGPNQERQKSAHVHMVIPSPDNELLFATDLGEHRDHNLRSLAVITALGLDSEGVP